MYNVAIGVGFLTWLQAFLFVIGISFEGLGKTVLGLDSSTPSASVIAAILWCGGILIMIGAAIGRDLQPRP